jgi:YHS domain-containing protein
MKHILLLLLVSIVSIQTLIAQTPASRQKNFNLSHGIGISGYDPVSYFKNKPVKGSSSYTYTYQGVTYKFANAENMNAFKQNPAGYEPQYGGWCAYAMGKTGEQVEVDPETYKILNGKLYLFYNRAFNNTLKTWNKDESYLNKQADIHWMKFAK